MRTKSLRIIRKQLIGSFLIGLYIYREETSFNNRIVIEWTFSRVAKGSSIWQHYATKSPQKYQ